jgi:hypothetical protein
MQHDLTAGVVHHRTGAFVTRVVQEFADGTRLVSDSRRHRKRLPPLRFDRDGNHDSTAPAISPWLRCWAPGRLAWWIAILFIIGSTCFAVASAASIWPASLPAALTAARVINGIYFVGSLFFTAAAWLQLLESVNGDVSDIDPAAGTRRSRWRWLAWKPHNAGYLASLIQFAGTLLFNFNTADAMITGLGWVEQDVLIWAPDVIGSVCFLVASYLAMIEISHSFWSFEPRQTSWWIAIINLAGCVGFQLSAFISFYPPHPGSAVLGWMAALLTFIGAGCFFVASYLMIPELFGAGAIPKPMAPRTRLASGNQGHFENGSGRQSRRPKQLPGQPR